LRSVATSASPPSDTRNQMTDINDSEMLKNTNAKENRGGKETTRNVNETESEV